jgi:phosphate transport system substrate-binding protein
LRGQVSIDGSSTVYPIAEAVSEEFQLRNPRVMVSLGRSGTGGGFERFCRGEMDVATASRRIRDFEAQRCAANDVEYLELPIALDGVSVVVNPGDTFVDCLSVQELREIWRPDSPVRTWRDVRPEFPAEEIRLYSPGTDSGTFDTFTEGVVGEMGASRMDFQASEDDNVLVMGLTRDRFSLGYFGYAYLAENRDRLAVVAVDGGGGCVAPSPETIRDGSYTPLGRQLFVYVKVGSLRRPGMGAFMEYFMNNAQELIPPTGFLPLPERHYADNLNLIRRIVGALVPSGVGLRVGATVGG